MTNWTPEKYIRYLEQQQTARVVANLDFTSQACKTQCESLGLVHAEVIAAAEEWKNGRRAYLDAHDNDLYD